jgi:TolB-like protein
MKFKRILIVLFLGLVLTFPSPSTTQTKDPARIYRVAILPFLIHSQENLDFLREGIYDILASRISVEGNISVIERSLVERAFYEERPMRLDETVAAKIGTRAGADFIVLGSLTKIGDYISLDARLISITEEKPPLGVYTQHKGIDDVMVKIGDFAQDIGYKILGRRVTAGRPSERRRSSALQSGIQRIGSQGMDFKRSQTFDFEIKGLDVGDVDGDGKNEVVFMDTNNLYIFRYDGDKLNLFQHIQTGHAHNFLTLDVADLNRNGHAEIIVTSVVEDNLRSFILEYEEKRFKKITEKEGWFFRVLEHPKDGPILIGQKMGSEGLSVGPIYKFDWKKKSFEKGQKMPFPKETNIFGFALADIRGNGKPEVIVIDSSDRLRILSEDGKIQWRSGERFGGTNNSYDTKKKLDMSDRSPSPWRVYIPGRILVRDLDGEGIPQIIINKNEFGSGRIFQNIRTYERGEIWNLVWDQDNLMTNWRTRDIAGYIADYQVKDVDNDGNEELVAAVVSPAEEGYTGIFSKKSKSNILIFELF